MEELIKIKINLQLFAEGEKTEEATPQKKQEARKKGQVAKSTDLSQISTLLIGIVMLKGLFGFYYKTLYKYFNSIFVNLDVKKITVEKVDEIWTEALIVIIIVITPILVSILLVGLTTNYMQVGFLFTTEPLKPSFEKINPIKGLKNLISLKKLVELLKSIIKLIIIGIYAYIVIKKNILKLLKIPYINIFESFTMVFLIAYDIAIKITMSLFIVAVVDYFYQKWEFNKSLKMSKQEIKEEFKQTEGDPQIKSKMRAMQRELLKRKMIEEVPNATVIITNPTHLSIALKYDEGMRAPTMIAKGADHLAMKIREIANESKIPILENKPLARALYKALEPGDEIPEEYYKAVAEVLKYVFNQKK
ncbi:MAG: flagellar biosynthesis protein FlhB [Fusobacteriia bacterium 4572_132]|nr:MAG: flagellar biosynthesis protein FlhB [Fusobacteriia bacterium 4572_132]